MSENKETHTSLHDCFLQAPQTQSILSVLAIIKKTYMILLQTLRKWAPFQTVKKKRNPE